jgi:hypothetical protein
VQPYQRRLLLLLAYLIVQTLLHMRGFNGNVDEFKNLIALLSSRGRLAGIIKV